MINLRYLMMSIFSFVLLLGMSFIPCFAAEKIIFRYGLLEESLPVADLRNYAEKQEISSSLEFILKFFSQKERKEFYQALQVEMPLDLTALDQLLDTELVKDNLAFVSQGIVRRDQAGIQALDGAIMLGANSPKGLGIISFLEAYPSQRIVFNVPTILEIASKFNLSPPKIAPQDNLSSTILWKVEVQYQQFATKGRQYSACLFGDSVTAELGNTLGKNTFNFALNGLSGISLVEQLKLLIPTKLRCEKAVIAIGANDAWYGMSDELFAEKLQESISLIQQLAGNEILLIPAFYSTVLASNDPTISATNTRVKQINSVMQQVAIKNNLSYQIEAVESLNQNDALKDNLSSEDGVHLNNEGINIYRQALLKILDQ
ncbi:alpha/beta hydrolase [Nostoc sp. CENA67]|uniref:Alpha/beta hydrolase n=1 Tax=Amazonocrinis nigriterrae CENA67 TaxID=2794033 RepID=A0A8J7L6F7_9NOST|nr:alpha/beta hydrolase [Amazonocrinis nigriterrae]MBH8562249.1 alpha/beta hydrolase [Amazonocrinis nigriterrae CENA67]